MSEMLFRKIAGAVQEVCASRGIPLYQHHTSRICECAVYEAEPVSDDGLISTWKFRLRLVAPTAMAALKHSEAIRSALLYPGDLPKMEGVLSMAVTTGDMEVGPGRSFVSMGLDFTVTERSGYDA